MAVVAPAGPVPEERYRAGLQILASRYRLVHAFEPARARSPIAFLAESDAARAEAFNRALRDPQVEAIFCARGGHGCLRILPLLDGRALVRRRPLLVGFSDITALHAWAARLDVATVHGPVVTQLPELPPAEVQALFDLLEGRHRPQLVRLQALRPGVTRGPLAGGNLTLLGHLCGTPWQLELGGHILLLEDVNEAPYRLDRILTQLRLAGGLAGLNGVLLGSLTGCQAPEGPAPEEVIVEQLGDLGVPVACGAPVGHGEHNLALPLGLPAELDADHGWLRFL